MLKIDKPGKLTWLPVSLMMSAMFLLVAGTLTTALTDDDLTRDQIVRILADNGASDPEGAADRLLAEEDSVDMDDVREYLSGSDDDDDGEDNSVSDSDGDDDSDSDSDHDSGGNSAGSSSSSNRTGDSDSDDDDDNSDSDDGGDDGGDGDDDGDDD